MKNTEERSGTIYYQQKRAKNVLLTIIPKIAQLENIPLEDEIKLDLTRCNLTHEFVVKDVETGNNKVFNVLKAYGNLDPEISSTVGFNVFVVLLLLYEDDEEKVFWMLVRIMIDFNWRENFKPDYKDISPL
eukprot:CAMPEP_0116870546 /NCGR_PEP_ID=MMETSP0463-20121206/481_1 /TAXON_ID=181622 /ORGANISM="Strombidinopsis sp, Strain SopsisLIS2011" /LENGTH=130 /DNA_ID=CAMNT_0004507245 /DNA_START=1175 /DNA_END=1569 /DNA_ORIENTATION=-